MIIVNNIIDFSKLLIARNLYWYV